MIQPKMEPLSKHSLVAKSIWSQQSIDISRNKSYSKKLKNCLDYFS